MIQAKFSITDGHREFLEQRGQYGFKDKSEVVRTALDHLRHELMRRQLADSADIYSEIYSGDEETKEWNDTELSKWPE